MMTRLWHPVALAAVVVYGAVVAPGQSTRVGDLGVGKLLVSARNLTDPNFAESVVLLVQYDNRGTVGLMINRRTKAPLSRILEHLNTAKHGSEPVYVGGPVELAGVLGLFHSRKKPDAEATSVLDDVYLVSSKALLEKTLAASSGPNDMRLYVGYCGWAVGQLENEVRQGGWWVFDGNARLVFDPYPESVWSRLITRTELQTASTQSQAGSRWGNDQRWILRIRPADWKELPQSVTCTWNPAVPARKKSQAAGALEWLRTNLIPRCEEGAGWGSGGGGPDGLRSRTAGLIGPCDSRQVLGAMWRPIPQRCLGY